MARHPCERRGSLKAAAAGRRCVQDRHWIPASAGTTDNRSVNAPPRPRPPRHRHADRTDDPRGVGRLAGPAAGVEDRPHRPRRGGAGSAAGGRAGAGRMARARRAGRRIPARVRDRDLWRHALRGLCRLYPGQPEGTAGRHRLHGHAAAADHRRLDRLRQPRFRSSDRRYPNQRPEGEIESPP